MELLGANVSEVLLIYEWESGRLWRESTPDFLKFIQPGSAYLLVNWNPGVDFDVDFPAYNASSPVFSPLVNNATDDRNNSPWNDVVKTSLPHFLMFEDEVLAKLQPGDIIGAFNQYDVCVGMEEFVDRSSSFNLVAMGDDPLTLEIDGFETGEVMTFKLYRQATEETYDVSFTYDAEYPNYNGLFAIVGVSNVVDITLSITSLNDINNSYSVNVFPNPAKDVINITSDYSIKSVTLVNYVGQTVFTQPVSGNSYQINVSEYVTGMYFVRVETTDGSVITKRIAID
jgi:hypothetical protein